jgi:hypothetical protein
VFGHRVNSIAAGLHVVYDVVGFSRGARCLTFRACNVVAPLLSVLNFIYATMSARNNDTWAYWSQTVCQAGHLEAWEAVKNVLSNHMTPFPRTITAVTSSVTAG